MLALRTSTSLSALGLVVGIAATSWLTALTYERAPATRRLAEVVMPKLSSKPAWTKPSASEPAPRARPRVPAERPIASRSGSAGASAASAPVVARRPDALVPVYMPSPRYPMAALRAQHEGQVILNVTVTQDGDVTDVSVGHSSGDLDLDRAAEAAVRGWRFAAADDRPFRYTADLPIRFELTHL
ncbi:TonB family protein [Luteibacter sp. OK325]|jgi:protein TonB|uniref:energy transducer TonB n=1 Tax=Luteibacter sp. OK325 TaxID=2135670 RepID=UPI000D388BAE|nr:energy transducer TonB [Luteibacter sp. OK325]PTR32473.1 TonB family protein [Luteibacter sp. OK325]